MAMSEPNIRINFMRVILLYLLAVVAGAINLLLGIAAFVCLTFFLLGMVWLMDKRGKETTG